MTLRPGWAPEPRPVISRNHHRINQLPVRHGRTCIPAFTLLLYSFVSCRTGIARRPDEGFTLIELLVVIGVIGVLASLAVTQVLRARASANESAAIGSLRAVNTAEQAYAQLCRGFAVTLPELRAPGNFISPDLAAAAAVAKSGYLITLAHSASGVAVAGAPAGCNGPETNYYASAEPLGFGTSGTRAFATSGQITIYFANAAVAPAEAAFPASSPIQ